MNLHSTRGIPTIKKKINQMFSNLYGKKYKENNDKGKGDKD